MTDDYTHWVFIALLIALFVMLAWAAFYDWRERRKAERRNEMAQWFYETGRRRW